MPELPNLCGRKVELLHAFSAQAGSLSRAAKRVANTVDTRIGGTVRGIAKQDYERVKADADQAYTRYLEHRRKHGC